MTKQLKKEDKEMVNLTIEQVRAALEIIKNDLDMSEFSTYDFEDVDSMRYLSERASLYSFLKEAVNTWLQN